MSLTGDTESNEYFWWPVTRFSIEKWITKIFSWSQLHHEKFDSWHGIRLKLLKLVNTCSLVAKSSRDLMSYPRGALPDWQRMRRWANISVTSYPPPSAPHLLVSTPDRKVNPASHAYHIHFSARFILFIIENRLGNQINKIMINHGAEII